jgi:hypothetical protein
MNAPPKEKPLLCGEGLPKLTKTGYGPHPILQVWAREAARLLAAFRRTGDQKHLRAFFTHVAAMRDYEARTLLDFMCTPSLLAFSRCFQPTLSPEEPATLRPVK